MHLSSRALAGMLRRLPGDYLAAFGVRVVAAESFTDPGTHAGTTYAACGFTGAGLTAGYGRSRGPSAYVRHGPPKGPWGRELGRGGLGAGAEPVASPPPTRRRGPGFHTPPARRAA